MIINREYEQLHAIQNFPEYYSLYQSKEFVYSIVGTVGIQSFVIFISFDEHFFSMVHIHYKNGAL